MSLANLGRNHLDNGDPAAAESCLRESLEVNRAVGANRIQVGALSDLGAALTRLGRLDEAKATLDDALALHEIAGWREGEIDTHVWYVYLALESSDAGSAADHADAAVKLLQSNDRPSLRQAAHLAAHEAGRDHHHLDLAVDAMREATEALPPDQRELYADNVALNRRTRRFI
jgi:tetratricopeptide (TPR) repeat protein